MSRQKVFEVDCMAQVPTEKFNNVGHQCAGHGVSGKQLIFRTVDFQTINLSVASWHIFHGNNRSWCEEPRSSQISIHPKNMQFGEPLAFFLLSCIL